MGEDSKGMFDGNIALKATLSSSAGDENGQIALRTIVFGMSPGIMITPELDDDNEDDIVIHVECVDLTREELCDLLELCGRELRNATEGGPVEP